MKGIELNYTISAADKSVAALAWGDSFAVRGVDGFTRVLKYLMSRLFALLAFVAIWIFAENSSPDGLDLSHYLTGLMGLIFAKLLDGYFQDRLQREMKKAVATDVKENGQWSAILSESTVLFRSEQSECRYTWKLVVDVRSVEEFTALRIGLTQRLIPNSALPEGLTPDAFRTQLQEWKDAKCEVFS
ncbi:hypothetical protein [Halocynthiibacter namhaensis]|uniref:hypothetical protein n=1 Tax=Halocynthiibacter namhaensis TaxID=1290553 RepID=UPI0005797D7E|nr:hypothetical protein [Halocynthiibacter namhaensis]